MTSKRLDEEAEGDVGGDFISGLPLSIEATIGSGVTDSEPVSVFMAVGKDGVDTGNDELPYKFSVHEYLNLKKKRLNFYSEHRVG